MKKAAFLCLTVLLLMPLAAMASDVAKEKPLPEGQQRVAIPVTGMSCGACCTKVETALKTVEGVVDVKADYAKGIATVTFEKDKVGIDKIVTTINEKTSFKAKAPETKKT